MDNWRKNLALLEQADPDVESLRQKVRRGSVFPDPVEDRPDRRIAVIAFASAIAIAAFALVFIAFRHQPPPVALDQHATDIGRASGSSSPTIADAILDAVPPRSYAAPTLTPEGLRPAAFDTGAIIGVVWAPWCEPCSDTLANVQTVLERSRLGPSAFGVTGPQDAEGAALMASDLEFTFPTVVLDGVYGGLKAGSANEGFVCCPLVWVMNRDGTVVASHAGSVSQDWLYDAVYEASFGSTPEPSPGTISSLRVVPVPDLIGMTDQQALLALDRLGLRWVGAFRSVDGVEAWHVAMTDPAAGTTVESGSKIRLVIATEVTALPEGATDPLACPPDQRVAFGGPKLRIMPGGSAYIRGNTSGVELSDKVKQATFEDQEWHGIWHVIRDGSAIAAVDFDTLDGVACAGSGIAGA